MCQFVGFGGEQDLQARHIERHLHTEISGTAGCPQEVEEPRQSVHPLRTDYRGGRLHWRFKRDAATHVAPVHHWKKEAAEVLASATNISNAECNAIRTTSRSREECRDKVARVRQALAGDVVLQKPQFTVDRVVSHDPQRHEECPQDLQPSSQESNGFSWIWFIRQVLAVCSSRSPKEADAFVSADRESKWSRQDPI